MTRMILAAVLFLAGLSQAPGQEALPRDEVLKAAFRLCRDLPKMLETPIPTDLQQAGEPQRSVQQHPAKDFDSHPSCLASGRADD